MTDDKKQLFRELMQTTRVIHSIALRNRNEIGHFQGGGQIIAVLGKHDNHCFQNELAKMVHVRPGSLSQVLTRLEHAGFITRERDTKDRRQIMVQLTPEGQRENQKLNAEREIFLDALLEKVSVKDCQNLIRIGKLMADGLQEHYEK